MPHEIIVVDNASSDGSVELVRTRFPAVRMIRNQENLGFPKANNQALPLVRGEYILFLNPDSELQPGTLERMVAELGGFPERAAVGPRIRKPVEFMSPNCARRLPTLSRWSKWEARIPHRKTIASRKRQYAASGKPIASTCNFETLQPEAAFVSCPSTFSLHA